MPRWLPKVLLQITGLAAARRLSFTHKASRELAALGLGFDPEDARDVLLNLTERDSAGRLASAVTGEWMYVFKPVIEARIIYVKVIIRTNCIVVSFHGDEGADDDEAP